MDPDDFLDRMMFLIFVMTAFLLLIAAGTLLLLVASLVIG